MSLNQISLLRTLDLCAALKAKLTAIAHPTLAGKPLFETVVYHDDKSLADALQDLLLTQSRICLIVPAGQSFNQVKEGRIQRSNRLTSLDLVMADTAYTRGAQDAVFGGTANVGVLTMCDIVQETIAADPQLGGLKWCSLYPTSAAQIDVANDKNTPGRKTVVLNYETPSGWTVAEISKAWTS